MHTDYEVIIIGGGHAGCEAAWAAARMGARTVMLTMDTEKIAQMSCNPAIGGLAKGQMVREVDALGGLMGLAIDAAGIQFRTLNRSRGPAVWAPRAQADKRRYRETVQAMLHALKDLTILNGTVEEILVSDGAVCGVRTGAGEILRAASVIVTTGTFLRGLMHRGDCQTEGGRIDEPAAKGLSGHLQGLGFELGRLKTGTPPRLDLRTVRLDGLAIQPPDPNPRPFSFISDRIQLPQINCWITFTNARVHQLILDNLDRAPMYNGQVKAAGPRYCPSIEDKVVRFADRERHQIFLEPEGLDTHELYVNGISTSLPQEIQEEMVRAIDGLENARILKFGYAVEYDIVQPTQIEATLESKRIGGLFFAGQINGTSGYEEAAGQGLMAGINAARRVNAADPVVLRRDQAYIGVMIDDLITKGVNEPYRMFTSLAEHRMHLRSDNADSRLTPLGREMGLVDDHRWSRFQKKQAQIARWSEYLRTTRCSGELLATALKRPEVNWQTLCRRDATLAGAALSEELSDSLSIAIKYDGYLRRQSALIERVRRMEQRLIPRDLNYATVPSLRREAYDKFVRLEPRTLAQASRISGISPADIAVLLVYLDSRGRARVSSK